MKRSVSTRLKKEGPNPSIELMALNNFKDLAEKCAKLGPKTFSLVTTDVVLDTVSKAKEEGYELHEKVRNNILMRHVNTLVSDKKFQTLVRIISPWESSEFDPAFPKLSGVSEVPSVRLTTFKSVLFEQVLLPLIRRGQEQADEIVLIVRECMEMDRQIDYVTLDAAGAVAMYEGTTIFQALEALATNGVYPAAEDT
eukprot:2930043-Amphidinium_carterae.2